MEIVSWQVQKQQSWPRLTLSFEGQTDYHKLQLKKMFYFNIWSIKRRKIKKLMHLFAVLSWPQTKKTIQKNTVSMKANYFIYIAPESGENQGVIAESVQLLSIKPPSTSFS